MEPPRSSFSSWRCAPRGNPTHNALLLLAFGAYVWGSRGWPESSMMWCWLPGATLLLGDLAVRVTRWGQRGHRAVATFADCRAGVRDLEQALAGRPDWLSRITLPFVGGYML